MKKLVVLAILLLATNAHAGYYQKPKKIVKNYNTTNVTNNHYEDSKNEYGAKLDAPYLIQLSNDWYIGTEGGKDLYSTSADEGWFVNGKVTYTGTLFSFSKGK